MSRVLDIPDNAFVEEFRRIRRDLQELKNRQFMGYDITTIKRNQTANVTDVSVAGSGFDVFEVDFTADNQEFPFSQVKFNVTRGDLVTLADPNSYDVFIQDTTFTNVGENSFLINLFNNASGTIFVKAYVLSSDTGQVVVT